MFRKSDNPPGGAAVPEFSPQAVENARRCFQRGQELAQRKDYDYAIQMYINGLGFWPEAVEEGHKPCRAAALFRGRQKVSFSEQMRFRIAGGDPVKALLAAESLLAKDPHNIAYMEAMLKAAVKGRLYATAMWIGEILADAADREPKPNPAHYVLLREAYEEIGDRCEDTDLTLSIAATDRAVAALGRLKALNPTDMAISTDHRDVAGKLTIRKGKFQTAASFADSVDDAQSQRDLHDRDRVIQAEERLDELIAKARGDYEAEPNSLHAVNALVDLLCRRERSDEEAQAVAILLKAYEQSKNYRYKLRADDIRIRQHNRAVRAAEESGDREAILKARTERLRFELGVYRERIREYPTDLRMRHQYGIRLFKAGRYDDAIPVLQEARADPKNRFDCSLHVGRCFYEKGYYAQAIDTFRDALAGYEIPDDKLGKELHYWLGRACEADGRIEDALKVYGQLIQWDYNYRNGDVRKRIDDLKGRQKTG